MERQSAQQLVQVSSWPWRQKNNNCQLQNQNPDLRLSLSSHHLKIFLTNQKSLRPNLKFRKTDKRLQLAKVNHYVVLQVQSLLRLIPSQNLKLAPNPQIFHLQHTHMWFHKEGDPMACQLPPDSKKSFQILKVRIYCISQKNKNIKILLYYF